MYLKSLRIVNFKAFKDATVHFNEKLNVLTGRNNSGKSSILEAIALWNECFYLLLTVAKRGTSGYSAGEYILGPNSNRYFNYDRIGSVRSPSISGIFRNQDIRNKIALNASFKDENKGDLEIGLIISVSGDKYVIQLENYASFRFDLFNRYFNRLPSPFLMYLVSPVGRISGQEIFQTGPNVELACKQQRSAEVLRNRLLSIIRNTDMLVQFSEDLSYILFNKSSQIYFFSSSNVQIDNSISISYSIGDGNSRLELSLLGSGTLQTIEILVNLYFAERSPIDFKLIMFDEPDSFIHREVQRRLIEILTRFSVNNQLFISTHNEAFIRESSPDTLFHIEGGNETAIAPIGGGLQTKLGRGYKGIIPGATNLILRSLGSISGLDIINALECDRLIFVEGVEDALAISLLLKQNLNRKPKVMYWSLGGINTVFVSIGSYRKVFEDLKNGESLWSKSKIVIDRDYLSDSILGKMIDGLKKDLKIDVYAHSAYTFEASLFTDLDSLTTLCAGWLLSLGIRTEGTETSIRKALEESYYALEVPFRNQLLSELAVKTIADNIDAKVRQYNSLVKANSTIETKHLALDVRSYIENTIDQQQFYKLMRKEDVALVLNKVFEPFKITFNIETDFIELLKCVDKTNWNSEWDFVNKLLS